VELEPIAWQGAGSGTARPVPRTFIRFLDLAVRKRATDAANESVNRGPFVGLTSSPFPPRLEVGLCMANPTSGGVTASTEMLAAKRHAGVHTPVIVGKMIIANQQMAYAA
jgi:hypothetical protein